jgi:hypothetical protein
MSRDEPMALPSLALPIDSVDDQAVYLTRTGAHSDLF